MPYGHLIIIKMYLSDITLIEKQALLSLSCSLCRVIIEIGDTYFLSMDKLDSGKFYCEECVEEERQI